MSFVKDILKILWESELNYKGVIRVNILGIPKFIKQKPAVSTALSRLKKRGYIKNNSDGWFITKSGEAYYSGTTTQLPHFISHHNRNAVNNLIVMFDIPEKKKVYRDWLRKELKTFGYILVQKSVWVGPSPLPKGFMNFVEEIGLIENIKTLKLSKSYK